MGSSSLVPRILTPFNYVDWREDKQVSLCNLGMFRMTMGRETEPHHPPEKNKFLNWFDEAFGFLWTHISWDLLFHLEGLKNPSIFLLISQFLNKLRRYLQVTLQKPKSIHNHVSFKPSTLTCTLSQGMLHL